MIFMIFLMKFDEFFQDRALVRARQRLADRVDVQRLERAQLNEVDVQPLRLCPRPPCEAVEGTRSAPELSER